MKSDSSYDVDLSVVCPFYNEEDILQKVLEHLVVVLDRLKCKWELLVVNDGSTDGSLAIARKALDPFENARVLTYAPNRGRGHALRTGIAQAQGQFIVTTEIDMSWGDDIVERIYARLQEYDCPHCVIASPHMEGGGYKNVPAHRVFLSSFGNVIIRMALPGAPTMCTGMTRGYQAEMIQSMPLFEERKEFHLEVVLKCLANGERIAEIPAILEWKDSKFTAKKDKPKRKSSSKLPGLVRSHLLFSVFAAPVRWMWALAFVFFMGSGICGVFAILRMAASGAYAFFGLGAMSCLVISLLFFGLGALSAQLNVMLRDVWRIQSRLSILENQNDQSTGTSAEYLGKVSHD